MKTKFDIKMELPLQENPSIITCIHHAYQCAVIESPQLAWLNISDYQNYVWESCECGTECEVENELVTVRADKDADFQDFVLWRDCAETDEFSLCINYMKPKDYGRSVDIFLFGDDLEQEIHQQDKSSGFRWNPYGFFVKKEMYCYDTKLYKHMRVTVNGTKMIGYASKDGECWEKITEFRIDEKHLGGCRKIGIHAHFGRNYFKIWKNMNFIQLMYNADNEWKGIYLDYYFFPRKNIDNGYGYYTAFLETQYDTVYDVLELYESIPAYIKWSIRHFYYPELCLDEIFVQNRGAFDKYHYNHYNLFYGFDDEKQVFKIMGYGSNYKPLVSELPYSVFDNENLITSEKVVRLKYAANDVTDLEFNINSVKTALSELLNCINSAEKLANLLTQEPVSYGVEIFKILAEDETKKRIFHDRRIAFCILEHSRLMRERLDYLFDNHYLYEEDYDRIAGQSDLIVEKATLIMNLVMKCIFKKKENPSVRKYLLEMYEMERLFMAELLRALR